MSARYTGGLVYNPPGGWSAQFSGSNYLTVPDNSAWVVNTDYTVEFWCNATSFPGQYNNIFNQRSSGTQYWGVNWDTSLGWCFFWNNGSGETKISRNQNSPLNTWVHFAFVKSGTTGYMFLNGVQAGATFTIGSISDFSSLLYIGVWPTISDYFAGYISNLRIVKGTAVYTANFTPPTGALLPITNTQLLTCRYPTIVDGSTNAFTITNTGTVTVSTANPFPTSVLPNPALGGAGNGIYTLSQYASLLGAGTWPAYDPYYKNVVMNLHGNAGAVLPFNTDASINNFQVTQVGDTRSSNYTPFIENGYWSNLFTGTSNSNYLSIPRILDSTVDITLECWIYMTSTAPANGAYIAAQYVAAGADRTVFIVSSGVLALQIGSTFVSGTIAISVGSWNHVAFVRSGNGTNNWSIYVNGVRDGQMTYTGTYQNTPFTIGATNNLASTQFPGYISNLRLLKGTALYSGASFTPPTAPLTAITNTALLTCQSNRIIDNSASPNTITVNGTVSVDPYQPFTAPTGTSAYGSGYFDGTGDWLTPPTGQTALTLATSDFTIEMWAYPTTQVRGNPALFTSDPGAGLANTILVQFIGTTGQTILWVNNTNLTASSTTNYIRLNQWNHIAICRSGGSTYTFYINGVAVNNVTTNSTSLTTSSWYLGYWTVADNAYTGYLSNFRIVKGTVVYTGAFTPPTTPLTAITNTSLLTVQTNVPTQNSTFADSSGNNWELVNTGAPYQGTLSPFSNNWSAYFVSSSTSYLSVASNAALNFGTGDFTFEYWFYRPAGSSVDLLITNSADGTGNDNYFYLVATPTGAGFFGIRTNSGETNFTGTIAAGVNTWAHLAVSRQSGLVRMFMNGTLCGSLTMTGTLTQRSLAIGAFIYPGYSAYSNGYLSDVRLIKGTALYTSSFTAPTAPLTAVPGTVLLTCQSNRYVDNSVNNFTITRNGGATIQRYSPFKPSIPVPLSYSGYFDGSGDYITAPSNAAFDFGSGDFTIEMWVNPSSHPSETLPISRVYDGSGNYSFAAYFTSGTVKFLYNGLTTISTSTVLSLYTWSHIAYVRSGTTLTIYVNGVSAGSGTISGSITASSYAVGVGARFDGSFPFAGWISNARIVKGTAVYTSAFTVQNYPLTAISGTSLLTCQSTTFVDNSSNAFAITVAGNAQPVTPNPFGINSKPVQYSPDVMGGSGYFDQTTSFSTPNRSGFNFGTGDFTVEAWFYPTGTGNTYGNSVVGTANGSTGWSLLVNRTINGYGVAAPNTIGSAILLYTTSLLPPYQWAHAAWVRSGTTAKLFVNGALVSTATDTTDGNITNALWVGSQANNGTAQNFPGYIGDVRIVKGTALYTNSFVPPTAPLTAVSGTTFLCNMTNAGIVDNSMTNDLQTVGNAQISTSVKKYGSASMYFDGTGDWLIPNANSALYAFGTGDFTIEFWIYVAVTQTRIIYDSRPASTQGAYPELYLSSNQIIFYHSEANRITGSTLANTTWYHIALCRSGTSTKLFVNGTQVGSTYTDSTNYLCGANRPTIGVAGNTLSDPFNGYLDDLRVTKGVARYTANFTPPTSQVQDQ